jgi:hypothetical protein
VASIAPRGENRAGRLVHEGGQQPSQPKRPRRNNGHCHGHQVNPCEQQHWCLYSPRGYDTRVNTVKQCFWTPPRFESNRPLLCHRARGFSYGAAALTVHCCWTPCRHRRGEPTLLLPSLPPPEWSTYDVTARARNFACRTEPYMHPACTAIQVSFERWTTNANRCVLSCGFLPSRVMMFTSARCSSKNRITLISLALRSDAQDFTTNPPHNHNTLIVFCTRTHTHRSQKTHKRPHTPPRNQTTYHSNPLAYTY